MRIAVLSDIHGNLPALEAVVRDLGAFAPDLVVNLGDHVSGPLWAAETADLLMCQTQWVQIRGNHDRQLTELAPGAMGASDAAAAEELSERHRTWLASLPATAEAGGVLLCHGTPASDTEYLVEDVSAGFARIAQPDEIRRRLGGAAGSVLCGHSHVPNLVSREDGAFAANPGSVGLPAYRDDEHRFPHVIETGSPHARYLLLDGDGPLTRATFRAVPYDNDRAAERARAGMRPDWEYALRTGYAVRQA